MCGQHHTTTQRDKFQTKNSLRSNPYHQFKYHSINTFALLPKNNKQRPSTSVDGPRSIPRRGLKSRLLQFASSKGYAFVLIFTHTSARSARTSRAQPPPSVVGFGDGGGVTSDPMRVVQFTPARMNIDKLLYRAHTRRTRACCVKISKAKTGAHTRRPDVERSERTHTNKKKIYPSAADENHKCRAW